MQFNITKQEKFLIMYGLQELAKEFKQKEKRVAILSEKEKAEFFELKILLKNTMT